MSTQSCRHQSTSDDAAFADNNPVRMETLTEIAMATEMETTTVAVPAVLAVRVEVRVPAARTAAPYTSLPRHLPSTAMCLCVQLQDSHEQPSRHDPKYMEQARKNLLAKFMSGQEITYRMLRKEMQRCFRVDYQRWHKQHIRAKTRHARDEAEATRLADELPGKLFSPAARSH